MAIYISELLNMGVGVTIGGGGLAWKMVSINTDAEVGSGYIADTSLGEITITLPQTPVMGDQIGISDYNNGFFANHCIVSRNSNNIMGIPENFICDINNMSILFVFVDSAQGWKILYGI